MKSLSLRGMAGRPKRATDCGTAISMTFCFTAAAGSMRGMAVSRALAGSVPNSTSSMAPKVLASMSPTATTRSVSLAKVCDQ